MRYEFDIRIVTSCFSSCWVDMGRAKLVILRYEDEKEPGKTFQKNQGSLLQAEKLTIVCKPLIICHPADYFQDFFFPETGQSLD